MTRPRPVSGTARRWPAAQLIAALDAHRTGRMHDIVETIQAEQDRVIRSEAGGVIVVQGGPGTGRTAVALHRAAYLLYTSREQLSARGVLIVGPNPMFLRYISQADLAGDPAVRAVLDELWPVLTPAPRAGRTRGARCSRRTSPTAGVSPR
jgi:hypothetical protein